MTSFASSVSKRRKFTVYAVEFSKCISVIGAVSQSRTVSSWFTVLDGSWALVNICLNINQETFGYDQQEFYFRRRRLPNETRQLQWPIAVEKMSDDD
jgi:hypothetical protein